MRKQHTTARAVVAMFVASLVALATLPGAAAAEDIAPVSVDTNGYDQQMADLKNSYSSLTAAMTAYYAVNRGQAFSAFLADNPTAVNRLSGANNGTNLSGILSQAGGVQNAAELDELLRRNGVGLDVNSWSTLGNAAADLQAKSRSLDAAVVNAGMNWAAALSMLVVPSVKSPGIPALDTTLATAMPAEGLAFGLFMNRSLANLIGNFPDVFSQVRATGVASADANAKWRSAMQAAGGASYAQLRNVVGASDCGTAFVDGLTGTPTNNCSPCAVAGMYGNAQLQLALDPSAAGAVTGAVNPVSGVTEWADLTPDQRAATTSQNPVLAQNVEQALSGSPAGCAAVAPVVKQTSNRSVNKVLDFLEGR